MQWTLTRKVAAMATIYLVLIVALAIIIGINTLKTEKIVIYLEDNVIEEVSLTGAYHTNLQRLMTEVVMYIYTDDKEEEYDEAIESIEQLEGIVASIKALEDTEMYRSLEIDTPHEAHEAMQEQQSILIGSGNRILHDVERNGISNTSSEASLSNVFEAIEDLEEEREALAETSDAHISELRAATTAQVATRTAAIISSIGGAVAILLLLTVLMLWRVASSVVYPVKVLAQAAHAVSGGNLNQRVAVTSRDEIGTLQDSFNQMVATLRERTSELEVQYAQAAAARDEAEVARHEANIARDEAETAYHSVTEQLEVIEQQQRTIREMSVPILPLSATTLVIPLVGAIDTERAQQIMERLLEQASAQSASVIIIDITGVSVVDTQVAQALIQTTQAIKLLGARVVLTGIRPQIAQTLVELGIHLGDIVTHGTLQDGIAFTLTRTDRPPNGKTHASVIRR